MTAHSKYAELPGGIVMLGFGSIGQGVLPLLTRHLDLPEDPITIFAADANGAEIAREQHAKLVVEALTQTNYRTLLAPLLGPRPVGPAAGEPELVVLADRMRLEHDPGAHAPSLVLA